MDISYVGFAVEYCRRFGQTAVERGLISPEQLKEALAEQIDDDLGGRRHRLLGDILFEKKWMTAEQVESVLNETLGIPAKACRTARRPACDDAATPGDGVQNHSLRPVT